MSKVFLGLVLSTLVTLTTGCFAVNDNGPIMSVELFWDEQPNGQRFSPGDCSSAGVDAMQWSLLKVEGNRRLAVDGRKEACADAIDIFEPAPGEYILKVVGDDAQGKTLWNDECSMLWVSRFDVAYDCNISAQ